MNTRLVWVCRGLVAGAIVGLLALAGWVEGWERLSLDARAYLCARFCRGSDVPVTVVAIDDKSLSSLGRWPWPRSTLASLLRRLVDDGARTLAVDIILSEPGPGDLELASALLPGGTVLPVYGSPEGLVVPVPVLAAVASQGHIEVNVDQDGVVRGVPIQRAGAPPLGVVAARLWCGEPVDGPLPGDRLWLDMRLRPGARRLAVGELISTVSAVDVMTGGASEAIAGRLVFVGLAAAGTAGGDAHITPLRPLGAIPGVYIHAEVARAELLGRRLRRVGPEWRFLLTATAGSTVGLVVANHPHSVVTVVLILVGYAGVVLFGYGSLALWLPWVGPSVAAVSTMGWATIYYGLVREQERRELRRLFSRYVPPSVLPELIARSGTLGLAGVHRNVAVLFADVRGFTALVEPLTPVQVLQVVNCYLEAMATAVREHGGMVDKYLGDGLMAVFGAPVEIDNPAAAALHCAVAMHAKVASLRPPAGVESLPGIGIGLHIGEAIMGTVGGRERLEYTAMGDVVNVAARLEELASAGTVLFTAEVLARAQLGGSIREVVVPVGPVTVRGKRTTLQVYKIISCDARH